MHYGSCLCGSIKFSVDDALKLVVNCHCRFCRKAHGAPFTTVSFVPFATLSLLEGKELLASFDVPAMQAVRCFCSRCGTRLYSHSPSTGMISLVVATLDTPAPRPLANINAGEPCSWHAIDDRLPRFSSVPAPGEWARLLAGA
jgi:hypothetical protein